MKIKVNKIIERANEDFLEYAFKRVVCTLFGNVSFDIACKKIYELIVNEDKKEDSSDYQSNNYLPHPQKEINKPP